MSGFAGIIRLEPSPQTAEADRAAIARMAEAIAFRGPDAQQQWQHGGASFAFSLLTTGPAPQAATQPVTLDGNTWLLGDVRLDRRKELMDALNAAGSELTPSATDEEIVLFAWKQLRADSAGRFFQEELHGDFAFAIWEPAKRELNCFRDVMGCRPFYYCAGEGAFAFGNTMDALHHVGNCGAALDEEFLGDFLLLSWCPRPAHTVYRAIRRLPAGHRLTLNPQELTIHRFQQLPVEDPLFFRRPTEYVEAYRELLSKAVADRLPRDSASIFLSGGLDSTTVATVVCQLRKQSGAPPGLSALSMDLQPLFDDREGLWAGSVASYLGIDFERMNCGGILPFTDFAEADARTPEPVADPYWANYRNSSRRLAAKSRVMLSGYGGDNVLNNETWPYLLHLARRLNLIRIAREFGGYAVRQRSLPPLRAGLRAKVRKWMGHAEPEPVFPDWLAPDFARRLHLQNRWKELWRPPARVHPIHPLAYFTLTDAFWPHVQDKEDAAATRLPVDTRSPLLDFRLLRFLLRLPSMPWCAHKSLMRRAMRGLLPEDVLNRPKSPLPQEPLGLHIANNSWHPSRVPAFSETIRQFVDWPALLKHAENVERSDYLSQYAFVPPISINYWLTTGKSR